MTRKFYVYVLFRENGEPFYIGKGYRSRINAHLGKPSGNGRNPHKERIINSMLARGIDIPRVKIRIGLTETKANETEIAFIKAVGRKPNGPLVNLTDGGEGRVGVKLSASHKARFCRTGPHSESTKVKISAAHKGKRLLPVGHKWTENQRLKITAAAIGNKHCAGRKFSKTSLEKLSTSAKKRGMLRTTQEAAWNATRSKKWSPDRIAQRSKTFSRNYQMRVRGGYSAGLLSQGA